MEAMADAALLSRSKRDGRLDVLRGLCLFDMVLVHLIEQGVRSPGLLNEVVMHWLRFAAGGFVMTSGVCVGAIHFQRALDPDRRAKTYAALLQRAAFVLGVHYFASVLTLILIPIHGRPVYEVGTMLRDILTFHAGYDLLLFYVFMLLVSPVLIELLRRVGVLPVLAASVSVFFWHYDNPYLHLWSIEKDFPLVRWQLIFVVGLAMGSKLKAFDAMTRRRKGELLTGAVAVALALGVLSAVERVGWATLPWYCQVTKMPLSVLEVARYLSLAVAAFVVLDRYWATLADTTADRVLRAVGVQSLMLWVVHVPIVGNVASMPWPLAVIAAWTLVWAAAVAATWASRQWATSLAVLPKLSYVTPVLGSLAVTAVLLHYQVPRSIATPYAAGPSMATDESVFFDDDVTEPPIPLDVDSVSEPA